MLNRISHSSVLAGQTDELSKPANDDRFDKALAALPERMGCCTSKADAADPANPSTSSPPRMSIFLSQHMTAELQGANRTNICVGLTAAWLGNLPNSPRSRMTALLPGSDGHRSAAVYQRNYESLVRFLRGEEIERSEAGFRARATVLRDAGLLPSETGNTYTFGDAASFSELAGKITADGRAYSLSLCFERGGRRERHLVATSASDGMVTLFDPNYGEFAVPQEQISDLFENLANRYRNPNGLELLSITTQRVRTD
ncbi:YopT-type cysteine protease domain-containing protein [Bradyrhizobium sp. DOA9]|uniref:YopT-type cysteine protease domain-containing protein n=1 Tax=Bradyrhizobium sp. DOA9 TaxID=1126627 RepID=UPI000469ACBB|nr:YopT-type cysteine protease domain-containing protein [Bradyrhizobium sp. DOA9]GAJ38040.1 putative cysteine protease yopT-like y4zC [Bradyrhizobium sp. DOA9]